MSTVIRSPSFWTCLESTQLTNKPRLHWNVQFPSFHVHPLGLYQYLISGVLVLKEQSSFVFPWVVLMQYIWWSKWDHLTHKARYRGSISLSLMATHLWMNSARDSRMRKPGYWVTTEMVILTTQPLLLWVSKLKHTVWLSVMIKGSYRSGKLRSPLLNICLVKISAEASLLLNMLILIKELYMEKEIEIAEKLWAVLHLYFKHAPSDLQSKRNINSSNS